MMTSPVNGGRATPLGSPTADGGTELLVALRVAARGSGDTVTLACTSVGGTTVAVLEGVQLETELLSDLSARIADHLQDLLAQSGAWRQGVRLAYPDGTPMQEADNSLLLNDIVNSAPWREAQAVQDAHEATGGGSAAARRRSSRADSKSKELEARLAKLQDAKHLPMSQKRVAAAAAAAANTAQADAAAAQGNSADSNELPDESAEATAAHFLPTEPECAPTVAGGVTVAAPPLPPHVGASATSQPVLWQGSICGDDPNAPDPASRAAGGRVVLVTSLDEEHPGDNVIDENGGTYWLSTGLYPQEVLLQLGRPSRISAIRLSTTNVRAVRIEGCSEESAVNFQLLASDFELDAKEGWLQMKELRCDPLAQSTPTRYLRATILSGWHDFCSVHRIVAVE